MYSSKNPSSSKLKSLMFTAGSSELTVSTNSPDSPRLIFTILSVSVIDSTIADVALPPPPPPEPPADDELLLEELLDDELLPPPLPPVLEPNSELSSVIVTVTVSPKVKFSVVRLVPVAFTPVALMVTVEDPADSLLGIVTSTSKSIESPDKISSVKLLLSPKVMVQLGGRSKIVVTLEAFPSPILLIVAVKATLVCPFVTLKVLLLGVLNVDVSTGWPGATTMVPVIVVELWVTTGDVALLSEPLREALTVRVVVCAPPVGAVSFTCNTRYSPAAREKFSDSLYTVVLRLDVI